MTSEVLLADQFYITGTINEKLVQLQLFKDRIQISPPEENISDSSDVTIIILKDILGIHATEARSETDKFAYTSFPNYLQIFWYPQVDVEKDGKILFKFRRRHIVLREYMGTESLLKWKAVIAVSGDGLLYEMINGLHERPDWRVASKTPIGIIPAGSGNGLARSLANWKNEEYVGDGLEQTSLGIAKGNIHPLDLTFIETGKLSYNKYDSCHYSFLSVGFALLADVDIESEHLRFLGEIRFYLLSVLRLISPRYYRAKFSYLLADEPSNKTETDNCTSIPRVRQDTSSSEGYESMQGDNWANERLRSFSENKHETSSGSLESIPDIEHDNDQVSSNPSSTYSNTNAKPQMHIPNHGYPRLSEPVPENWKTLEDDFVIISAVYQSHLAKDLCVSPESKPNDGHIYIIMVRGGNFPDGKVPRSLMLEFLLKCESGEMFYHEKVDTLKVKAFRFEPMDRSVGNLTVDGERIATGPIQAVVLPGAANIVS